MGVDLRLYIEPEQDRIARFYAQNELNLERDSAFFEQIAKVPSHEWPRETPFSHLTRDDDKGALVETRVDAYDEPLRYVYALDLANVDTMAFRHELHPWNRAILRFISSLDANTRIVLYWH